MKQITPADLDALAAQAQQSSRLRANRNLHVELSDPIQRLAIAMEPGTYVRAQRHPHTWELLYPLSGRFVVLNFDDAGAVIERTVLGEDCAVLEIPAGCWHAVLSLDVGGVIFEVKHGPYMPVAEEDFADWSGAEGSPLASTLMSWYATAQIGQHFSGV
ncbi:MULTISPECIES: WbuC family cupin fold metalloprotein [unclassified Pseudomonas]|uniref:WbuC family cupin fold metalloprotein n=1 Tax=unclassified Pseudomonas TaxID=196821 RepID=UPI002AC95B9E|nr:MULTISPECIES: WbuC family cupin fold metalloprotein [unclassified Pseudomonas]MEB0041232.1 WbuC family cupin fold metalloprotein [Pseudomonas sp. MH10]MEB0078321.1 WbuC family cupin fold metalloprotein [Pseudomonas sp. MH10out]MEB0092282.1 WbuC family cupin fold metalloprotein [Pseudomonas sp. CCI4.2]MEB0101775.1 WbuC family cupin fold metalloprotein [Pseudomonas sp. CCI3.2]MEB0123359.1 WbuC family cupin fold metalloprotein [Pseudomonas sp. CCI1.2]